MVTPTIVALIPGLLCAKIAVGQPIRNNTVRTKRSLAIPYCRSFNVIQLSERAEETAPAGEWVDGINGNAYANAGESYRTTQALDYKEKFVGEPQTKTKVDRRGVSTKTHQCIKKDSAVLSELRNEKIRRYRRPSSTSADSSAADPGAERRRRDFPGFVPGH